MGREVRMVPADWKHPTRKGGGYRPLHGDSYAKLAAEWEAGGLEGETRPRPEEYMPEWPASERTHYQMYETCTEGTPLSPPMATPEALAHYLAQTGASAFGRMTATYDQWLAMIRDGWAPSAVISPARGLVSGVEAAEGGAS